MLLCNALCDGRVWILLPYIATASLPLDLDGLAWVLHLFEKYIEPA